MLAKHWTWFLYFINTIFAVVALAFIILSIAIVTSAVPMMAFLPKWIVPITMTAGIFFLSVIFCGFKGASLAETRIEDESKNWWLVCYAMMMILLSLVQIGGIVGISKYAADIKNQPDSFLQGQIEALPKHQWKDIQDSLGCCGYAQNNSTLATSTKKLWINSSSSMQRFHYRTG